MKNDTIQTRKWITMCLMALLTFCLVLTGIFFIAPIEAEAASPVHSSAHEISGTWTLTEDVSTNDDQSYWYGFVVPKSTTATIEGNEYILSKGTYSEYALITVESGATLTINNLTLAGNTANGGFNCAPLIALQPGATVTVNGCTLRDNNNCLLTGKDYSGKGGAVYISADAMFTMNDSEIFACNVVVNNNSYSGHGEVYGGAIYNEGNLKINSGSSINNCGAKREIVTTVDVYCTGYGGAIYQAATATYTEGGVEIEGQSPRTSIVANTSDISITYCDATYGGAIYVAGGYKFEIYGLSEAGKVYLGDNGRSNGWYGGAIYAETTEMGTDVFGNVKLTRNGNIYGGTSYYGSVIYASGSNINIGTRLSDPRVQIYENFASSNGTAIYCGNNGSVRLDAVDIINHTDTITYEEHNATVMIDGGTVTASARTNISNNSTEADFGAVNIKNDGTLILESMPCITDNYNTYGDTTNYIGIKIYDGQIVVRDALTANSDSGEATQPIPIVVNTKDTSFVEGWANANADIDDVFVSAERGIEIFVNDAGELYATEYLLEPTYNLNGGTASVELPSGYYAVGDEITITAAMWEGITRTGYTMGTVTCNGETVTYLRMTTDGFIYRSTTHTMTKDGLSFVVNWTANEYTVTFDQNGGTGGSPTSATVTYGSTYSLSNPVAPTKEGYRFEGYYATVTVQEGGGRPQTITRQMYTADMSPTRRFWDVAGNVTLTAKWTPIVTGIAIPAASQNQTYYLGADFVPFNITATYGDSTTAEIAVTEEMLTNFSTDTMGTRTATVTYEGKTATFEYTVSGYAYTVEHYQENLEDDDYTIVSSDTETLYGVGTTTAVAKEYTGFTAQTFEQTAIAEDGTTVVKIYYTRNTYTFTYDLDGGTVEGQTEFTVKWGEEFPININIPSKPGFTFLGYGLFGYEDGEWKFALVVLEPEDLVGGNMTLPFAYDMKFLALWAERQVESISIPTASQNQSYVVDGAFVPFNITVTYDNGETESVAVTEAMLSGFSTESAVDNATATVTYTEGEVTKTSTFTYSVTNGYAYTVKHYQQTLDIYDVPNGYALKDTQTLYGTGTTNAVALAYEGFSAKSFTQVSVAEDGSTIVEIYYDRNTYTVVFNLDGGTLENADSIDVLFGAYYDLPSGTPKKDGYTFKGWAIYIDGEYSWKIAAGRIDLPVPLDEAPQNGNSVEARVIWAERVIDDVVPGLANNMYKCEQGDPFVPFDIEVIYDNGDVETYTAQLEWLEGFSTEEVGLKEVFLTYEGFRTSFPMTVSEKTYDVTFNIGGATGTAPSTESYTEGATVTLPTTDGLTKTGYTFGGWSDGTNTYEAGAIYTISSADVSFTAVWKLKAPTITIEGVEPLEGDNKAEYVLEFTYDGNAHNVTLHTSHELGDAVTYTYYMIMDGDAQVNLNPDNLRIPPWHMIESDTYGFVDVDESAYYSFTVTVTDGNDTAVAYFRIKVAIGKADQTITLSENEFIYSEGLTIDFADYVDGTGDGTLSFEVSDKNGVEFDFANGVVSNITKAGGTFTLTVNKAASDNCNAATETFTVTLNKGAQTLSVSGTPSAPNWKEAFTVSVSGNKGALSYAITSGNASVDTNGVITASGAGQVRYSVTAAATDLYEAKTQEFSVTFAKAAGNLAPDYATSKPTNLTICVGHTSDDITLPTEWRFQSKTTLGQVGNVTLTAVFTPSDTANYSVYTENLTIAVTNHTGGTAASCTTDQVCTECGEVLVEALGHDYTDRVDNTVRTTAQHCQECNTYWYDCSRCGASAKNDANATDKWYTSNEAGEHNMSSDWTSENGQHFHKCTVSGCDHVEDTEDCDGGRATCQTKATCDTCGASYGELGDHSYNYGSWGYTDENGHANNCIYCDAHTELQEHEPNVDAATEDTAKYCTFCGYVIEQQLNHVHSEGTAWEYDSEYHWHDCVANDGQVYSKDEHTYDHACDTTCNVCNATRTITHDYSKLEKNDTEHWYVCSVCGSEKANSRVAHSGGTKDCQHKAECATCGQTYGDFGDHAYDTTVWVSVDNEHHAHKCMLCDAYTDETEHFSLDEATYTEDKLCDACGHKMADALGFELNNVVYKILTNEEGNYTVEVYGNTLTEATEVIIPATVNDEGIEYTVVSIGEDAFRNSTYLTGVTICEGVGSIAKSAFENCNALLYAELPQSIYAIGIGAFCNCSELRMVNIPYTVNVIEEWTFNGCHKLENIEIHEGIIKIGYRAFYNCYTLPSVVIPYSVETLDKNAFYGCTGLEEMRIYSMKVAIGENAIPTDIPVVYCEGAESTAAKYCAENGISFQTHEGEHVDKDKNHICDYGCSEALGVCEDNNFDHNCDYGCEKTYGEHSDGDDNNHLCDYGCQKIADDGCYDTVVDGKCDECGENIIHDCKDDNKNHECDICGTAIGNHSDSITDKDHLCDYGCGAVMENCVPNADDGDCTTDIICSICGAITTEGAASHIGGNATCTEKAECTVCGKEYGELEPHSHGSEWKNDADEHWNECECGDKANKAAHVDSDSNGACDTCGYVMNVTPPPHTHSHGSTWVTDANEHWNECECGDKANKAAHVDDNNDNKCDTCDYAMPAHDPDTPPVDNPPTDDNDGLGTGAIIGIVVAAVAVVGGGGFALFWFVIRKKRGF